MNLRNFFAELKRRNVYKVAVAYAVVAVALDSGGVDLVSDLRSAGLGHEGFVVVLVLCFPVALVFSWAFEITPEGIKRESDIDPANRLPREPDEESLA